MLWRAGSGHRNIIHFHPQPRWFPTGHHPISSLPLRAEWATMYSISKTSFIPPNSPLANFPLETSKFLAAVEMIASTNIMDRDQILQRLEATPSGVLNNSKTVCAFAQEMIENACPEHALHVLHVSHRVGIVLAHNQYEQIAYRFATHHHWNHVYSVAAIAEKHTGRWTARLLNWVIRSQIETRHYALLSGVLELFKRDHLQPSRNTFHLLVCGHLQNVDLPRARSCLIEMRNAGFQMDKSTYLTVLGAYRTLGPNQGVEEQAFQALRGMRDPSDTIILNGLMQLRIDDDDNAGALRVLELFALPPLNSRRSTASVTPSSPITQKTPPDDATFNILLAFLAKRRGGLNNVLRIFGQISVAGLRVNVEAVAALICAYFTANMSSMAVAIVAEMCFLHNLPVEPEDLYFLGHRAQPIPENVIRALHVRPTIQIFNTLLQGILREHEILGMRRVLRIMRHAGVTPDSATKRIILSYLCDVQHMRPRPLIQVLHLLSTFPTDQASITIQQSNMILRTLLRRERDILRTKSWNATAQRVRLGHRAEFSPKPLSKPAKSFDPTAGIALSSFRRSVEKSFQPVIQSLVDAGVKSDSMTFALSIRRSAVTKMDLDEARRIFDIMVERGIRPRAYHFSALIEGHVVKGDIAGAREVMRSVSDSGIALNVVMYTILILGYARMGRPDLAMRTFSEMKSAGVDPDFAVIDAVVSAYYFVREYRTARSLLLDLWHLVAPFPPELADASLHELIRSFRALRQHPKVVPSSDSPPERSRRLRVKRQVERTFVMFKNWQRVPESVSWAKQYVGLSPMLQLDIPGGGFDAY